MTTQTQTQENVTRALIWSGVAFVGLIAVAYFIMAI
jgi:hypothetical protein